MALKEHVGEVFLEKHLKILNHQNIQHLVIDLRDNGGGQINLGLNLLSYLIDKKIVLPFDKKVNTT
jgi:C-terminal processing protease CtpA/Prc